MGKKIQYIHLPIYSVATYLKFMYFSGGGGGKTGIPNQIFVFERRITKDPVNRISTGDKIYQNLTVSTQQKKLVCSANQNILVFAITEQGKNLEQLYMVQSDFSLKNPTINAISFHPSQPIIAAGGDDCFARFYQLNQDGLSIVWDHDEHHCPIRTIHSNSSHLFVSTDTEQVVVSDLKKKQHIRRVFIDQLYPPECMFQSAYFLPPRTEQQKSNPKLVFCHYVPRKEAYASKQTENGKIFTIQVSKDQSCMSSMEDNFLGIACGNGTTYLIDTQQMNILNQQKGHQFVITAAAVTKGHRFITGTPECSYLIQDNESHDNTWMIKVVLFLIIFLAMSLSPSPEIGSEL